MRTRSEREERTRRGQDYDKKGVRPRTALADILHDVATDDVLIVTIYRSGSEGYVLLLFIHNECCLFHCHAARRCTEAFIEDVETALDKRHFRSFAYRIGGVSPKSNEFRVFEDDAFDRGAMAVVTVKEEDAYMQRMTKVVVRHPSKDIMRRGRRMGLMVAKRLF